MESHPDVTRDLAEDPLFELANHSYLHRHLPRLSEPEIRDEIKRTQDIMFALTGKQGALFRAPFGEYDDRVLRVAGELGLITVQWDVVSGDPDRRVTARRMIAVVTGRVRNGSIIIMHMNGRGWHTAEALPPIIARLKAEGYTFVTVSDLLAAGQTTEGR
jgi:peptidoglycan/xylan/chitin deacetylase (PgdA/CDA1 family)